MSTAPLPTARLRALLDGMRGRRIVVIGDAMLDVYLRGDVDRISPEAPVPVVRVRDRKYALGGAANVGQNVVASGAHGALVAVVGDDASGARLSTMWAEQGGDGQVLCIDQQWDVGELAHRVFTGIEHGSIGQDGA